MKTFALAALMGFAAAEVMTSVDFDFIRHVASHNLSYEPPKNLTSEDPSLPQKTLTSKNSTPPRPLPPTDTTSSPHGLMRNSRDSTQECQEVKLPQPRCQPLTPALGTGGTTTPSRSSRIRDNAVHAGLSLLQVELKVQTPSKPGISFPSPSRSSSIATPHATAAVVAGKTRP